MRITPIAGALGADIEDVDVRTLSEPSFGSLKEAINERGVVAIREQTLTPADLVQFVRRFGEIHYHPHVPGMAEQPEVMEIVKTETDRGANFGAGWHSDQMFLSAPATYTCLYGVEIPEAGGDTLFADMRKGYATLSPGMQETVLRLKTLNLSVAAQIARRSGTQRQTFASMQTKEAAADEEMAAHPLVRRHPETGEPVLYVGLHTMSLVGFADAEARPLIDYWLAHMTQPENTCRLRWRPGTLAIWDNRLVLHNAINDYHGHRRRMQRVTVVGEPTEAYDPTAAGARAGRSAGVAAA